MSSPWEKTYLHFHQAQLAVLVSQLQWRRCCGFHQQPLALKNSCVLTLEYTGVPSRPHEHTNTIISLLLQVYPKKQTNKQTNKQTKNSYAWQLAVSHLRQRRMEIKKSRTYSRVREGIFSLSRLDFILAERQAGASFTTARQHSLSQPASSHSSLRWRATKNNPVWLSIAYQQLQRIPGRFSAGTDTIKRSCVFKKKTKTNEAPRQFCAFGAPRLFPRRTGERLPQNRGSDGSLLTSMWLVGREEREGGKGESVSEGVAKSIWAMGDSRGGRLGEDGGKVGVGS